MNRLSAGFLAGIVGAVLSVVISLLQIPFLGFLVVLGTGIVAGILVARNPKFAGKTGGAGALAGLVAGVVLLVAAIISVLVAVNSPAGQSAISYVVQTAQAQQTATAGTGSTTPAVNYQAIAEGGAVIGGIILGLIYLGISTGLGAAAGAIAGRNNRAAQVPFDANYPTFPQQPGYPPAQGGYPQQPGYPPSYGAQQPGYPPQQPPPQQP